MMKACPICCDTWSKTVRQTRSIALPAVTGTEMRTGLVGHDVEVGACARAAAVPSAANAKAAMTERRMEASLN